MQRDYWYSVAHPGQAGVRRGGRRRWLRKRTLRRIGRAQGEDRQRSHRLRSPVARSLLGHIFEAVNGDSIYRDASFLIGKLGEQIAGENINVIDDGTMLGGFGTSPFDSEGVPSRKTVVLENGVLKSYLLNTYTAKKLGLKTTGNASRGLAGNPGIGSGNFFLQPGAKTPQEIIADVKEAFLSPSFSASASTWSLAISRAALAAFGSRMAS